ncbi:MAG: aminoacyl-tRNA hydrolase [Candidatus Cloacimonetes bacterium]|nr:aminoacyl-tRNA hydrolase [Candidatus Cloacimonadota bacterium]
MKKKPKKLRKKTKKKKNRNKKNNQKVKLIVGLGNPGNEYENTRHNIGFAVVRKLCDKIHSQKFKRKRKYYISKKNEWIFLLPNTFMNLSGIAVKKAMKKYKINTKNLLVISDDVNLPVGKMRIRKSGGDGNHNGLKSIIAEIQAEDFPRLRIGIGIENLSSEISLTEFVLSKFTDEENEILGNTISDAVGLLANYLHSDYKKMCDAFSKI